MILFLRNSIGPNVAVALLVLLLFTSTTGMSQPTKDSFSFKLLVDQGSSSNIEIINLVNEKATKSNSEGVFTIAGKVGDLLLISGRDFELKRYIIDSDDLSAEISNIQLISKAIELNETVVTSTSNINARALGIIPESTPIYTPAERKLKTAGDLKPIDFLGLLLGGMALDPIFNAINGKTAALKKQIIIETRENRIEQYEELFGTDYFVNRLRIPNAHIKGFLFYVSENGRLQHSINNGDLNTAKFILSKSAVDYKNIHIKE